MLKHLMKEKHLTVTEMAKTLGMPRETLSRKLNGKQPLSLKEAFLIQEKFFSDLTIDELFRKIKEQNAPTICSADRTQKPTGKVS